MAPRRTQPDLATNILAGLGNGLFGLATWAWRVITGRPRRSRLNQAALLADWQRIEVLIDTTNVHQAAQAVSQADRFVDHVMQLVGAQGPSFADRLRCLEDRLARSTYQGLWDAHKVRNQLAHEHGSTVSVSDARRALGQFRAAVRELGAF